MVKTMFGVVGTLLALALSSPTPALAQHLDTATVTADCTQFTIAVSGGGLASNSQASVKFTMGITLVGGGTQVIAEFVPVQADAGGNFTGARSFPWGMGFGITLAGNYMLSGEATLFIDGFPTTAEVDEMSFNPIN